MNAQTLVAEVWIFAHVLRDQGVSYQAYIKQRFVALGHLAIGSDLPDRQFCAPHVKPFSEKYFCLTETKIAPIFLPIPSRVRGVSRSSRTLGRDAVDAGCAFDEGASFADGEVVWS